jgi:hypothetical protein
MKPPEKLWERRRPESGYRKLPSECATKKKEGQASVCIIKKSTIIGRLQ